MSLRSIFDRSRDALYAFANLNGVGAVDEFDEDVDIEFEGGVSNSEE